MDSDKNELAKLSDEITLCFEKLSTAPEKLKDALERTKEEKDEQVPEEADR